MHMFSFQSKGFGKAFPSTKNVNARPDVRHILKNFPATDCLRRFEGRWDNVSLDRSEMQLKLMLLYAKRKSM